MDKVTWIKTEIMAGPETDAQFLGSIPREGVGDRAEEEEREEKKEEIFFYCCISLVWPTSKHLVPKAVSTSGCVSTG